MDEEEQRNLLCEVLAALCADNDRCATVSQTFGLSPSLELLSSGAHDYGIKEAALRLKMRLLEARVALLSRQQQEAALADMRLSFRDHRSAGKDSSFIAPMPSPAKCPSFLGQHNGAAKVVSLRIEGLCSESDRELCKEKLLAVQGVISFTFDIERRRCVVRVRSDLSPRPTQPSAKDTRLDVGDEVTRETEDEKKDDRENLPAYLPEVDSPIRADAVVRQKKSKSSSATSWLGSAATFITKSLYW
ncbi:hypothetical protein HPB52_004649 [Rhipicephalus sanguineus]|uniref:Armadillo repeat-containing protein 1 n=1 Tax=Rhipicephalus sanguineus TaxID=34632 RepID=A0A9D4T705_RHISA|nr:hypothetical protein HPB52_004649 [Rhipicephalus sanguineus]